MSYLEIAHHFEKDGKELDGCVSSSKRGKDDRRVQHDVRRKGLFPGVQIARLPDGPIRVSGHRRSAASPAYEARRREDVINPETIPPRAVKE